MGTVSTNNPGFTIVSLLDSEKEPNESIIHLHVTAWDCQIIFFCINLKKKKLSHYTCVCAELELDISPGGNLCAGEIVFGSRVMTPRAG